MDLSTFCQLVDETIGVIKQWPNDLFENYRYLGMAETGNYLSSAINDELSNRIRRAFIPGGKGIAAQCAQLIGELIHDNILEKRPLNPYCEILGQIRDATQSENIFGSDTCEEWRQAIETAHLSNQHFNLNITALLDRTYAQYFATGNAAKRLKSAGYLVERVADKISISDETQSRLLTKIETLISELGGLYVAGQIFIRGSDGYDSRQERYHMVAPKLNTGVAPRTLVPVGYLYNLAVKHYDGGRPCGTADLRNFDRIIGMIQDYATILDVQDYGFFPHFPFIPEKLLEALQRMALADTLYKIPQIRGRDVTQILYGLVEAATLDEPFEKGWTIRQAIEVTNAIIKHAKDKRGPFRVRARDIRKLCPKLSGDLIDVVLSDVFSHPNAGANQSFIRPTDAPNLTTRDSNNLGADFSQLPLLRYTDKSYMLLDRSACSGAFIEAIFSHLRMRDSAFDRNLGKGIERFVRNTLLQHNIPSLSGEYTIGRKKWECDIVVETDEVIILIEVKKKPLTRRARAGSDLSLLLDLAQSLLDAQVQAGNHEMLLHRDGFLDLVENGVTFRLERKGRNVERIALSFSDFGSFHDRLFLEKFLNAILQLSFGVSSSQYEREFIGINKAISSLQEQSRSLYPVDGDRKRPFFNCWFFSLPQLLVLLDDVDGPEPFRNALWATRSLGNGSGDLYFDMHHAEQIRQNSPQMWELLTSLKDRETTFLTGFHS